MYKFKCPRCKKVSTAQEWDKATIEEYGTEIGFIQGERDGNLYKCPKCNWGEVEGDDIEEVTDYK
jgi:phage FluMu protein Com